MKNLTKIILCFFAITALTNCASIVSTSRWPLTVTSTPTGAQVEITDKYNIKVYNGNTPATLRLKSGAGYFGSQSYLVKLSMDGFHEKTIPVRCNLNGWYIGNIMLGGLLGMLIVDPLTGAMYKLETKAINETLSKSTASNDPSLKIMNINEVPEELKSSLVPISDSPISVNEKPTKQGNFVLSGGTGLQFISGKSKNVYDGKTLSEYNSSSFSIVPSFAYFVADDLAIGLTSNISTSTTKSKVGSKSVSNSIMLLPTAIYYFPMNGKIRPTAQIGVGLSSETSKYIPKSGNETKNSDSGLAINLGGGVAYFIKENVSFNFGLSYTMVNLTDGDDNKSKVKQGNFGSNISIAFYF